MARTPANDMVDVVMTCLPVVTDAKSTVSCRVGPNNADSKVVVEHGTFAACAFVHLLYVAVEHVATSTSMSNCKAYCVHRCMCDGNPLSYGSSGPDTHGKMVGTAGIGKTVCESTCTSKGPGTEASVHDTHFDLEHVAWV